jgi:hypothetical protein
MTVRTEPATREERDRATLALLIQIEQRAQTARLWLQDSMRYDAGDRIGITADFRQHAERYIAELRHLAAKLAATYGPEPVRVVPAEAVVDTGEHEPEDDGQPTDEEIDAMALGEAAYDHMTRLMRRARRSA